MMKFRFGRLETFSSAPGTLDLYDTLDMNAEATGCTVCDAQVSCK